MFDSTGNDRFYASPTEGSLYGAGFYNRAKFFEGVHAYATAGGTDVADLYDSEGDNTYVGTDVDGALFGAGFYNRAKHFEEVHAHGNAGGNDTALLYDAVIENGAVFPAVESATKIDWLYEFEGLFTASKQSNDPPTARAVDAIITAYWQA
jgi:hypothetical protein